MQVLRVLFVTLTIAHALTDKVRENETPSRFDCGEDGTGKQPPNRVNTEERLAALRERMNQVQGQNNAIDAFYVTTDDEHQSEMVPNYNQRLRFISGFSGSKGKAIITKTKAVLWTDGRYHLQADEELDCNWLLMRGGNLNVPSEKEWLLSEFPDGAKIGADPKLIPAEDWSYLENPLQRSNSTFILEKIEKNFIDQIWTDRNESLNVTKGFLLEEKFSGQNWKKKVETVRKTLKDKHCDALVITALDQVAWLLNIRGGDNPYANLLDAYIILTLEKVDLYINPAKISSIKSSFEQNLLNVRNYEEIWNDLGLLANYSSKIRILVPSGYGYDRGVSKAIFDLVPKENRVFEPSPITDLKAQKNSVERAGMERAHVRDAAALCKFLHVLESNFATKEEVWDELRVVDYVNIFRSQQDLYLSVSFPTIVGFGPHSALPHYVPTNFTSSQIFDNTTLVIDSGGQYYDGTTDVTRTIHLGEPEQKHRKAYTRVLIGCIQLSSLIFPEDLNPASLDVMARAPLWKIGYDYPHGTSHGIGASSNVHESPISIVYKNIMVPTLKPGNFLSNEPGYYLKDDFGVRLENIMEVISIIEHNSRKFYGFKDVTLVPYQMKLIDLDMLDKSHINWLNEYNSRIRKLVGTELKKQNDTDAYNWMMENTKVIPLKSSKYRQ